MFYSKIKAVGSYVPQNTVSNEDMSKVVDTNDEWISSRTGIKNRHFSTGENTSDLAAKAAEKILERAGVKAEDIELIVVASVSPDYGTPSTACLVQKKIGAVNAVSFDIGAACSGFIFAISTADKFIKTGVYKNALVLGAEVLSKCLDFTDRGTCVLFGDGSGGAFLEQSDKPSILAEEMGTDGNRAMALTLGLKEVVNISCKGERNTHQYIEMDGRAIFDFATRTVPKTVKNVLAKADLTTEDIDYVVPHQANARIIEIVSRKLKVPMDKFYLNMNEYANTSSASIPIALDEMWEEGLLKEGTTVAMAGFGAGLTWGSMIVRF